MFLVELVVIVVLVAAVELVVQFLTLFVEVAVELVDIYRLQVLNYLQACPTQLQWEQVLLVQQVLVAHPLHLIQFLLQSLLVVEVEVVLLLLIL